MARSRRNAPAIIPTGSVARLDRYLGYYESYAESHEALDRDTALQEEVRNVARAVAETVGQLRLGGIAPQHRGLRNPRPK